MTFFRRMYYDRATGEAVHIRSAGGDVRVPSSEDDFASQPELFGRTEADTGLLEWRTEDAEIERLFRTKKPSVDLTGEQPRLIWSEPDSSGEYDEVEDMRAALEYLGVGAEEGE